jgi:hypothetical protein
MDIMVCPAICATATVQLDAAGKADDCVCVMQGREGTAALFDKLKVGAVVVIKGRPQPHPAAAAAGRAGSSSSSTGQHEHVLDVVVQDIRVLHKSR